MTNAEEDVTDKMGRLLDDLSKEDYEKALFPTRSNWSDFEKLVDWLRWKRSIVNQHEDSKKKCEIMINFFSKLEADHLYDPVFEDLIGEDHFEETKKINISTEITMDNFRSGIESPDIKRKLDSICRMYAVTYERTCKLHFKPLAARILKKEVNSCGLAIQQIKAYDSATELVLDPFIPQVRNSIDHTDWYYDKQRDLVIFEDRDKPPLGFTVSEFQNLSHFAMISDVCISAARDSFKEPLWKAIIVDSKKVVKYCDILGIDHDALLEKYLLRGYSLFEVLWRLEQKLKQKGIKIPN